MSRTIPVPSEPLLTRTGQINPIWWRYLRGLESQGDSSGVQEQIREILRRLSEIPEAREVIGRMSVVVIDQPDGTRSVQLDGDSLTPGSNAFYCTDPLGRRQWAALSKVIMASQGVVFTDSGYTIMGELDEPADLPETGEAGQAWWIGPVLYAWGEGEDGPAWLPDYNPSGLLEITLSDITPEDGGTLQKTAFDDKGRRTHEGEATTDDLPEGSNLYHTAGRVDARITAQKGQPSGLATLDANAKLDAGQLPALAITETFVVNTEAAMLALDVQQGDVAVRSDLQASFILTAEPASTLSNWQELLVPTGVGVASFNGRTGTVTPQTGDYTPAQVGAATAAQGSLADSSIQPGNPALSDSREWTASTVSQVEAEAGTDTTRRAWTAQRVRQATSAWWAGSSAKTMLDGLVVQTITDGDTTHAPSGDVVFDALASAGLGTTAPLVPDLDSMAGGTARFFAAAAGSTGIPAEVSSNGGVGMYVPYNAGIAVQFWSTALAGVHANRLFFRIYRAGAWIAWSEIRPFDTGWADATLLNSWVHYGSTYAVPGYRRIGSQVFLRGLMKDGITTSGTDLFVLPPGYRPAYTGIYTTPNTNLPTANVRIRVSADGIVDFLESPNNAAVSVDGITFFVD